MTKLCVVIPTYNEAENLPKLTMQIEKVLRKRNFNLIVVDDNSPDNTAKVAQKLNQVYGNIIVRIQARKYGLGSAILEGLKIALAMKDVERIVTLDGDLSHDPSEIPKLLYVAQKTDFVQGSRYVEDGAVMGWGLRRRLISYAANMICKLLFRISIRDCTGNFRVYSRACAETIVKSAGSKGFEWVVEALFVAKKHGFGVKEVPITFMERKEGKTKLKALQVVGWALFTVKNLFSLKPLAVNVPVQSSRAIHRSSAFTVTVVPPMTSTTTYTLSSRSLGWSDQAELIYSVKSSE